MFELVLLHVSSFRNFIFTDPKALDIMAENEN